MCELAPACTGFREAAEVKPEPTLGTASFQSLQHFWAETLFSLCCRKLVALLVLVPLYLQLHERLDLRLPQDHVFSGTVNTITTEMLKEHFSSTKFTL